MKIIFALFALTMSLAASAQTDGKTYLELAYGAIKYQEPGAWATPGVGMIRLGSNIDKNISLEGLIGTTITDAYSGNVAFRFDSVFGGYIKARTDIGPNAQVFGRLGFTQGTATASVPSYAVSGSDSGLSYGVGAQFDFASKTYVIIDYMSYYSNSGVSASGISGGIGIKF